MASAFAPSAAYSGRVPTYRVAPQASKVPQSRVSIPRVAIPPVKSGGVSIRPGATVRPVRADFTTYYDPSRVIDLDRLKVVKDQRQQGTERGETQSGDGGELGPGGTTTSSEQIAPGRMAARKVSSPVADNKLLPVALAVAAYFLLGG